MKLRAGLRNTVAILLTSAVAVALAAAVPGVANAATNTPLVVAYQGQNGHLWYYVDSDSTDPYASTGAHDSGLGMSNNSSAAITFDNGGALVIAFRANTGLLCIYTPLGGLFSSSENSHLCTGLGVAAGTSPSIAPNDIVAFEAASTYHLWYYQIALSGHDTGLGMEPLSDGPSISEDGNQIAFEANTDTLYLHNIQTGANINTGLGMNIFSSPSIGNNFGQTWDWVAFDANTCNLWYWDGAHGHNTGLGMNCNTSPSMDPLGASDYMAFEANSGSGQRLFVYDAHNNAHTDTGLGMIPGTSPSLGPLVSQVSGSIIGYQVWFGANGSKDLYYYNQLTDPPARGGSGVAPGGGGGAVVNSSEFGPAYTPGVRCSGCP
jgi:hypothetical protein